MNMTAAGAIEALADPTRRAIFERLGRGACTVGTLAAGLPVTRPAVSQHLKVLRNAGLVRSQAQGTRRIHSIDPRGLEALRAYLDRFWAQALDTLKAYAESEPPRA